MSIPQSIPESIISDIISNVVNLAAVQSDVDGRNEGTHARVNHEKGPLATVNNSYVVQANGLLKGTSSIFNENHSGSNHPSSPTQVISGSATHSGTSSITRAASSMKKHLQRRSTRRKESARNMMNSSPDDTPSSKKTQSTSKSSDHSSEVKVDAVPPSSASQQTTTEAPVAGSSIINAEQTGTIPSVPGPSISKAQQNSNHPSSPGPSATPAQQTPRTPSTTGASTTNAQKTNERTSATPSVPDPRTTTVQENEITSSTPGPSTIQPPLVRKSLPGPLIAANRNVQHKIPYQEYCANDLNVKDRAMQRMILNGRSFQAIRKVYASSEELIQTKRPKIAYRKPISSEKKDALLNNMLEKGIAENFGRIVIIRDEDGDLVVVDGCQRLDVLCEGVEKGLVGIGDAQEKKPSAFRCHMRRLPVMMLVPEDCTPLGDLELLGISIALNVGESRSRALTNEDLYKMLIHFIKNTLGERSKDHYILHISDLVDKTTKFNILDHLFSRKVRNETIDNETTEKRVPSTTTRRRARKGAFTVAERNRRERYSVQIRAAIAFIDCPESLQVVFGKRGLGCPLWTPHLFSYLPFLNLEDMEKTATLHLLGKRHVELLRKGKSTGTTVEARRCVDLIIEIFCAMRSSCIHSSIMESATFEQLIATKLTRHEDKSVKKNAYFHSIVFLICKWNGKEEGQWGSTTILNEVKKDFEKWPHSRKWKTFKYDLDDLDDDFYQRNVMFRHLHSYVKQSKKRKATEREQAPRKVKRAKVINDESEDEYTDMESDEASEQQDGQNITTPHNSAAVELNTNPIVNEGQQTNTANEIQPSKDDDDGTQANVDGNNQSNSGNKSQTQEQRQADDQNDDNIPVTVPQDSEKGVQENIPVKIPQDIGKGVQEDFDKSTATFLHSFCEMFGLSDLSEHVTKELKTCNKPQSSSSNPKSAAMQFVDTFQKVVCNKLTGNRLLSSNEPDSRPQLLDLDEMDDDNGRKDGVNHDVQEMVQLNPERTTQAQGHADLQTASSAKRDASMDTEEGKRLKLLERRWKMLSKQLPPANDVVLPEACNGEGIWKYIFNTTTAAGIVDMVRIAVLRNLGANLNQDSAVNNLMLKMFMETTKKDMQYQGFTLCKGILRGCDAEKWITDFLTYYMNFFPGMGGINEKRKGKAVPWDWICNVGDDSDATLVKEGIGRYQVNPSKDIYHLYKHHNSLLQSKSKLEVFVAALINHILQPTTQNQLRLPVFGSKIIVHTEKADAQKCHCDYEVRKGAVLREEEAKYFAVATGHEAAFLHVWPMGHIILSSAEVNGLKMKSELLEIPPYSVCLLRGDLPHAGAGAEDDVKMRGKFELSPRVHFYVDREEGRSFVSEPNDLFFPPLVE